MWAVGLRGDSEVYAEAIARARRAERRHPEFVTLVDAIARLGRLAGEVKQPQMPAHREPVPEWLAARLVQTAGMSPAQVAALDAERALDAWTAFISKPKG